VKISNVTGSLISALLIGAPAIVEPSADLATAAARRGASPGRRHREPQVLAQVIFDEA